MQNRLAARVHPFRVGIADAVQKAIAYQLLAPALTLADPVKLVCREDRLEQLAADLSIHRLDMVLADRPPPPNMDIKGYSHPLGDCGISFLAARSVLDALGADFPRNLHAAPMLIPGEDSALRVPLLRWLERRGFQPTIAGASSRKMQADAARQVGVASSQRTASAGVMIRKRGAQRRRNLSTARSLLSSPWAWVAAASSMNFWSSGSLQRGIPVFASMGTAGRDSDA